MTIDLHSHILPGVDDGPSTLEEAMSLANAYVDAGINRVVATPHVNARWGVRIDEALAAHDTLASRIAGESVELQLEFGGEIALASTLDIGVDQLRDFRLGGGDWLLIEPPSHGPSFSIHSMIFDIQSQDQRVLLAHPERCQTFQDDLDLLDSLVNGGVRTQVTASVLSGRFGSASQQTAEMMFKRGLVHTVASDAHHATQRPPGMVGDLKRSGHSDILQWLCRDMPAWILDGGEEPPRPETDKESDGGSRGFFGRLGRRR